MNAKDDASKRQEPAPEEASPPIKFDPLLQRPARWIIRFYWAVILLNASLYLYTYRSQTHPIDLFFYPLFFVSGFLIKSLLWSKIQTTFQNLVQLGTLPRERLSSVLQECQRRLDHWSGTVLGVVFALAIVGFYIPGLTYLGTHRADFVVAQLLIMVIDVLLGYTAGIVVWKASVTALEFRRLAKKQELLLHPFHPDQCQGLSPIGHLSLSLSLILVVFGIFFAGWIVYYRWISLTTSETYAFYEPWFVFGLATVIVVSTLAFLFPMFEVHRVMEREARRVGAQFDDLGAKISKAEETLLSQNLELPDEQIRTHETNTAALRRLYDQRRHVPTWPIDVPTYTKFFVAQIPLWAGFASSAWSLWDKLATG